MNPSNGTAVYTQNMDMRTAYLKSLFFAGFLAGILGSCSPGNPDLPTVGFVDAFEDNTITLAKKGFLDALQENGFSEEAGSLNLIYRNAQNDQPTLIQIVNYMIQQEVDLLATNPTLSTITAVQNTDEIPIFMMTSPTPELMQLTDDSGQAPENLFGVAEDLKYIDTSFALMPAMLTPKGERLRIGLLYNQSEPQSVDAFKRMQQLADRYNTDLVAQPVNNTAEVQIVTATLLNQEIDAFFANPDNTIFSSFEIILKRCHEAGVPVFTSEAGLVARGALAAFGADLYQWGYQAGEQAAEYLKTGDRSDLSLEMVKVRRRVFNPATAEQFGFEMPGDFEPI
jgi:putative ABC transport system substrate-binding protein